MSKSIRAQQIADQIQRKLARHLNEVVGDPRLEEMNITRVTLSDDLGHARIYFTLNDESTLPEVKKALKKGTGYLRHYLSQNTGLRYVPECRFIFDESQKYAERIDSLLKNTKISDESGEA